MIAEGFILSDLAYAKARFELKKSTAYPTMLALCREVLAIPRMRPDLYVLLDAGPETIDDRQVRKNGKDRNATEIFRAMYYKALAEIHQELNETNIERVRTDSEVEKTLDVILAALKMKGVAGV